MQQGQSSVRNIINGPVTATAAASLKRSVLKVDLQEVRFRVLIVWDTQTI